MANPIKISTKEELLSIEEKGNYVLVNDIDLEGYEGFIIEKFKGQFDGQGHTISNFLISEYRSGLFGEVRGKKAVVSNLIISDATTHEYYDCGLIVGWLTAGATIENCTVKNSKGVSSDAGMICYKSESDGDKPNTIRNCHVVDCTIKGTGIVIGTKFTRIENCTIDKCVFTGNRGALIDSSMCTLITGCFITNTTFEKKELMVRCVHFETNIVNSEIITPKVDTNDIIIRRILESADAYEQLKDREELSLWGVYPEEQTEFPEVVTRLEKLKILNIGNNAWKNIPDSITNLKNLEELQLDCALSYIDKLPDLSSLKKLKRLRANGYVWNNKHPFPKQELLKDILKATQVEILDISKWGEYQRKGEIVRGKPDMAYLENLKDFANLEMLVLSHNSLEALPEVLHKGMNLAYLDISYNHISSGELSAFRKSHPDTEIEIKGNKSFAESDQLDKLMIYGSTFIRNTDSAQGLQNAVKIFANVLKQAEEGINDINEFTLQYAYYGKLFAYTFLTTHHAKIYNKEELKEAKQITLDTAYKILDIIKQNPAMHFSQLGGLQNEITRRAANTIGWDAYENLKKTEELEKAIDITRLGVAEIEGFEHYYIYDTLVRLLIKAKQKEEAYEIVKKCLAKYPAFEDFRDFNSNEEFQEWLKNN